MPTRKLAAAQAQHGSAPDIQGQDKANPISLILSASMLLDWFGNRTRNEAFCSASACIDQAIDVVLQDPAKRTPDLGGPLGTKAFTKVLVEQLEAAS